MRNIPFALMWLGVLALAACVPGNVVATKPAGPDVAAPAVTGSVTSLQNSALPPTAVLEVQLQDVSLADAPAEVISTRTIETKGRQLPIRYVLAYDPEKINQAHRYSMRATIKDGDKLLFTSTQAYPVITNGAPARNIEIVVEPRTL